MAEKITFPMLAARNWWTLRKKFNQTIPPKVTLTYLSSVLKMTPESASGNVLPYLKRMGLVDDEGKPEELANKWRSDVDYPEVCKIIRTKVYPQELEAAFPNPEEDKEGVVEWFKKQTGSGEPAAKIMASLYILLSKADPSEGEKSTAPKVGEKKAKVSKEPKPKTKIESKGEEPEETQKQAQQEPRVAGIPTIHIDLQIHLSPEATADQIDQIFASMARHLKDLSQSHK
jgi:hypothetical protein